MEKAADAFTAFVSQPHEPIVGYAALRSVFGCPKSHTKRVPPKLLPPVPPADKRSENGVHVDSAMAEIKEALVWILDAEEVLKNHRKTLPQGDRLLTRLQEGKWWSSLLKKY